MPQLNIQETIYIFCSLAAKFLCDGSHSANWSHSWTTKNAKEQNQKQYFSGRLYCKYDKG